MQGGSFSKCALKLSLCRCKPRNYNESMAHPASAVPTLQERMERALLTEPDPGELRTGGSSALWPCWHHQPRSGHVCKELSQPQPVGHHPGPFPKPLWRRGLQVPGQNPVPYIRLMGDSAFQQNTPQPSSPCYLQCNCAKPPCSPHLFQIKFSSISTLAIHLTNYWMCLFSFKISPVIIVGSLVIKEARIYFNYYYF